MNKINVGLYGGRNIIGKDTKERAEIIYCDNCGNCDLYKRGFCKRVTDGWNSNYCPYGRLEIINGYTPRAKNFYNFDKKYREDAVYSKLNYPHNVSFAKIDEYYMVNLPYCKINNGECCNNPFDTGASFIKCENFTNDLLYKICTYRPQAMMGGTIKAHQEKCVPDLLLSIKRNYKDIYNSFISKYKEFCIDTNYIGKKALLNTINIGNVEYYDATWYWNGETLRYISGKSGYMYDHKFDVNALIIKPKKEIYVTITSNDQVNEETIFNDV